MALTHTNDTLSDPLNKSEMETNFSETRTKFGNISNADISVAAGIAVSKLAVSNQEFVVNLRIDSSSLSSGWPAATTTPLVFVPVPGDITDDNITVQDVTYWCSDIGAGTTAAFIVQWGRLTGGVWKNEATVVASTVIASVGNPSVTFQPEFYEPGYLYGFGLQSNGTDATCLDAANTTFSLSLLCRRVIQP